MMRKNQKGFTLVELIIAVAILAIVTLAVCGFIVVGSRSYTSANTDIMLQQEAQLALNQISDVIIDTTDSISYSVGAGAGTLQNVLKDSEYDGEATDKCLIVVNRTDTDSNNLNPSYWFYWSKPDETIYFNEVTGVDPNGTPAEIKEKFKDAEVDKAVLAEHVTDLNIDISQFEENRVVMISMKLQNGNREYSTSNNVTVRNRIALNVVEIDPMKRADEFRIENISSIVLEPGDSYTFDPSVTAKSADGSAPSEDLVWELVGGSINGTTAEQNGKKCTVHVGIDEVRKDFTLRVSRAQEDYVGQNDRVARVVRVEVKRVNKVELTASASTVKAGDTVEITGKAVGWKLTLPCNGDGCGGDEISKDRDLNAEKDTATGWRFVEGSGTIESYNEGKAVVKINPSMTGGTVTIEATSRLSMDKNGGYSSGEDTSSARGVQGRITLRVEEQPKEKGDAQISSGYKFGTDNDDTGTGPVNMTYDYMYNDLAPLEGTDTAVVCARVREIGETDKDKDQVILYYTTDKNIRFYPDMFGLDLTRSYEFYMQIIVPVRKKNNPSNAYINRQGSWEDDDAIIREYYGHLDDKGKYIEHADGYYASQFYYGMLTPPVISIKLNGVNYPNSNKNLYESYHFNGGDMSRVMNKIWIGDVLNVKYQTMLHNVRFAIYKDTNSNWVWDGGYKADQMTYASKSFANNVFTINPDGDLTGDPFMQRGSGTDLQRACGTYYIAVGYEYANIKDGNIGREYIFIDKRNIHGDFELHYYEQPECTITFKVDMGNNIKLPPENNQERWTFFPLPNDSSFPFALKSDSMQTTSWYFTKYDSSGNSVWDGYSLGTLMVDCEYDSKNDRYTIWLYTVKKRDGASYTRYVYGKYKCDANGSEWIPDRLGFFDEDVKVPTNIEYTKDNHTWEAYFPLPDESGFPFTGSGPWEPQSYRLQAYDKNSNYDKKTETVIVTWDGTSITIKEVRSEGAHKSTTIVYGEWKYNGSTWVKTPGSEDEFSTPIWDSVIYFKINSWDSKESKIEMPLPGSTDLPALTPGGSSTVTLRDVEYFDADDLYGTEGRNEWYKPTMTFVVDYSLNSAGTTYTMVLKNEWGGTFGTWTCNVGDSQWRK